MIESRLFFKEKIMDKGISVGEGALWFVAWLGVILLYTFLDVAI